MFRNKGLGRRVKDLEEDVRRLVVANKKRAGEERVSAILRDGGVSLGHGWFLSGPDESNIVWRCLVLTVEHAETDVVFEIAPRNIDRIIEKCVALKTASADPARKAEDDAFWARLIGIRNNSAKLDAMNGA